MFQVDHQELLKLGIISFILMTFIFEPRVMWWGEFRSWSFLGVKVWSIRWFILSTWVIIGMHTCFCIWMLPTCIWILNNSHIMFLFRNIKHTRKHLSRSLNSQSYQNIWSCVLRYVLFAHNLINFLLKKKKRQKEVGKGFVHNVWLRSNFFI